MTISSALPQLPRHEAPTRRFDWGRAAFGIGLLAAAGASVCLLFATVGLPLAALASLFSKNSADVIMRQRLLLAVLGGGAVPAILAGGLLLRRRQAAVPAVDRAGRVVAPLTLAAFFPLLVFGRVWQATPLYYLLGLALLTIGLERTLWMSFEAMPGFVGRTLADGAERFSPRTRAILPWIPVLAMAAFYAAFVSYYTILNHRRLGTAAFDLGINVNWMYNAMHGKLMRTPVLFGPDGGNMIAGHAIYAALFLWLPFFALKPGAEVLLVYQAVTVALAAIPLYKFARTQLPATSAMFVAVAFLFFAPLHGANFYDFHELLPALFFHFAMYYGIASRKNWLVFASAAVLFLIREDIPIGMSVVGAFMVYRGYRPKLGLLLATASVSWFVVDKFVLMPMAGSWWFANIYAELLPTGEHGYGSIVKTILINPGYFFQTLLREQKLIYALHMFAPVAFLPARRLDFLIVASPGFFFTLMTTGYGPTISISFQYTTHWAPYLFGASILALRWLGESWGPARRRAALGAMLVAMASHSLVFGAFSRSTSFVGGFSAIHFTLTPSEQERYQQLRELAAMIPQSASVAATEAENPHVCARMDCYTLRLHHGEAEFLLFHKDSVSAGNKGNVGAAMALHPYGLFATRGPFYLFKKNHVSTQTDEAKAKLGLGSTTSPTP